MSTEHARLTNKDLTIIQLESKLRIMKRALVDIAQETGTPQARIASEALVLAAEAGAEEQET